MTTSDIASTIKSANLQISTATPSILNGPRDGAQLCRRLRIGSLTSFPKMSIGNSCAIAV